MLRRNVVRRVEKTLSPGPRGLFDN